MVMVNAEVSCGLRHESVVRLMHEWALEELGDVSSLREKIEPLDTWRRLVHGNFFASSRRSRLLTSLVWLETQRPVPSVCLLSFCELASLVPASPR